MSPAYWVLKAEMEANGQMNADAIIAHVTKQWEYQPEPNEANPPRCYWCETLLLTPQDGFVDEILTGVFGYWYCSAVCRDAHVASK